MKEHYLIREVAEYFSVSERTIKRVIKEKNIPITKIRNCTRIHRKDLKKFRIMKKS